MKSYLGLLIGQCLERAILVMSCTPGHTQLNFLCTERLPQKMCHSISRADEVFDSAVSTWEMAIKQKLGKLELLNRNVGSFS